jgi:hypothetical protein
MRRNLDALSTELYNAVSNWNDFTENEDGERILSESECAEQDDMAFDTIKDNLQELELI